MSTDLVRYVADANAAGMTLVQIAEALSRAGWNTADLASALTTTSAATDAAVITVQGLTKRYAETTAVDGISFQVRRGEVFGILGPNGAGKTTTLEIIEGLRRPTEGTIVVDGMDVLTHTHAVKSIIGVQLQASTFFEGLTLRETLVLFASLYGRTVDPMDLLASVQLTEKANQQVKELSGGQKQRFSIAVGLVNDPVVLFLDEPTTGLDPQARRNLWDLIRNINARGTTVVLTTHYMDEAEVLCDRIAIMDHARIVALDTTRNLLATYGGASSIEFRSTHEVPHGALAGLSGVQSIRHDDGVHAIVTSNPKHTMDELFGAGRVHGFSINELTLKRATLEDVFLTLTGHQLRDAT